MKTEIRKAMCPLKIEECRIVDGHPGVLDLTVITDPDGICLFAFGPHSGSFHFPKGPQPPALQAGDYHLWVNGAYYGILHCQAS